MTKNTLMDLNNALFEQMERLNDVDCNLETEVTRSKAMTDVGKVIVENAKLALEAEKFRDDRLDANGKLPRMLGDNSEQL